MQQIQIHLLVDALRQKGVCFDDGLNDNELALIEARYHIHFPTDLRALLRHALPVGDRFPDWRNDSQDDITSKLNTLFEGIYFDIEHNNFWWDAWGTRPVKLKDALMIAKEALSKVPHLIPIYSHHYISQEPTLAGNPVFSILR